MPLSNEKGEGFENKIAQVLGTALGTGVQYYWRPSIERGLMRTTLGQGNCDLWMDMPSDAEGALVLSPLYRSTFVLAYRNDKGIRIQSLDDPALKKLRIGVFQVSALRQALAEHHIVDNIVVHYVSHNADVVTSNQPSHQVQQVIDGSLDVAAVWGPMAGYYQAMAQAPLIIQPVNLLEDDVPMEFDMALAVPRGRPDIKAAVETALTQHRSEIRKILSDFGVPLVKCGECIVSGDLPSHGPYKPRKPEVRSAAEVTQTNASSMAHLKNWLAQGAKPDEELSDAIAANDLDRVVYLLAHGAQRNSYDGEGYTPLITAIRANAVEIARYLIEHKADTSLPDGSSWTPLMWATWGDNPELVKALTANGARVDATDRDGLTPLAIAAQNSKLKAMRALLEAGTDVNAPVAKGGYTPLMLAARSGANELAAALLEHGANVNASNSGGVTALMIAAASDRATVLDLLLKAGAAIDARTEDGRTALGIARAYSNDAAITALEDAAQHDAAKSS